MDERITGNWERGEQANGRALVLFDVRSGTPLSVWTDHAAAQRETRCFSEAERRGLMLIDVSLDRSGGRCAMSLDQMRAMVAEADAAAEGGTTDDPA